MKKIVMDTNFVLIPATFKVDIFSEIDRIAQFGYQLCVVDKTINELKNLSINGSGAVKRNSKLALSIIRAKSIKEIKTEEGLYADDTILDIAKKEEHIVATQDINLKRRLRQRHIPIITLRQKKYLILQ